MDVAEVGIAVLPARVDGLHTVPVDLVHDLLAHDLTYVVLRQGESDLFAGARAVAHVDFIQGDTQPLGFRQGSRMPADHGRDQRQQQAQRQSEAHQAAAVYCHEWLTSVQYISRSIQYNCTESFYYETVTMSTKELHFFEETKQKDGGVSTPSCPPI